MTLGPHVRLWQHAGIVCPDATPAVPNSTNTQIAVRVGDILAPRPLRPPCVLWSFAAYVRDLAIQQC